ncbi:MAG: BMP family ABC transporter substrate-binding protein [Actinomycetota bacterium]
MRQQRRWSLLAVLLALALFAAACGSDESSTDETDESTTDETSAADDTTETTAADDSADDAEQAAASDGDDAGDGLLVAFMSNQAAGDQGPVDGMIAGLEASAAANGHETQVVEALDPAAFETQLRTLADSGADIIITTFFDLGALLEIVAPDYPDTTFISVVAAPSEQPNVNVVDYQFFKGAFLAGVYAATLSDTGQLGYVGGAPLPFAWADFNAFTDGASTINPDIVTTATFADGFEDPAGARELASGLYADGADVVLTGAAAGDLGVVEAAVENDAMVVVSSDLTAQGPNNVSLIVKLEWAQTIQNEITDAIAGEGGRYRLAGPESGEVSFEVPQTFLDGASGDRAERAEAVLPELNALVEQLVAGELDIEQVSEER